MKKEDFKLGDWKRIFLGEAPWEFLIEVTIRFTIVYLIFFLVMRLLGKRMAAQLTMFELIIIITLGAAISVPMETPDKGILPGIIILLFILLYEKGISYFSFKSPSAENFTQGKVSILVKDGRILMDEMKDAVLSSERLFAELRTEKITQLGEVERVYLEACGIFTIMKSDKVNPGLSILPEGDTNIKKEFKIQSGYYTCTRCGNIKKSNTKLDERCSYCSTNKWENAIINAV